MSNTNNTTATTLLGDLANITAQVAQKLGHPATLVKEIQDWGVGLNKATTAAVDTTDAFLQKAVSFVQDITGNGSTQPDAAVQPGTLPAIGTGVQYYPKKADGEFKDKGAHAAIVVDDNAAGLTLYVYYKTASLAPGKHVHGITTAGTAENNYSMVE